MRQHSSGGTSQTETATLAWPGCLAASSQSIRVRRTCATHPCTRVKRVEGRKGSQHAIAWTQGGNPAPAVAQAPCADRYPCVDTRADATLDRPLGGAILRATRWTTEYLGSLQVPDRSRVYSESERAARERERDKQTAGSKTGPEIGPPPAAARPAAATTGRSQRIAGVPARRISRSVGQISRRITAPAAHRHVLFLRRVSPHHSCHVPASTRRGSRRLFQTRDLFPRPAPAGVARVSAVGR